MAIPLLEYQPASQNQRVPGFEVPNEDAPRIYRLDTSTTDSDVQALIWAAYRQIFSEHETLQSHRQVTLETQLKNRSITVREFVGGLVKSEVYRRLVVETNSNYRIVELTLKRLLGRAPYNEDEKIAWSIKIATEGFDGFVNTLVDSQEYLDNFGENIVPYQRRRYKDRPFNLVTPRYADYWRDRQESSRYKWGAIENFLDMARSVTVKPVQYKARVNVDTITIPDTTRKATDPVPASVNSIPGFPLS